MDHLLQLSLLLFVSVVAVLIHKVVHGQEAAAHPNHDLILVQLHEHPFAVIPVHTLAFPLQGQL